MADDVEEKNKAILLIFDRRKDLDKLPRPFHEDFNRLFHDLFAKVDDQNNMPMMRNVLANKIANGLLNALADSQSHSSDLASTLASERMGLNPNIEGMLKQILGMRGISTEPDVLYGGSVPADIREHWQEMGMDPDSEDELFQFLERNGVYLTLADQKSFQDTLRNTEMDTQKKEQLEQFNRQQLQQSTPPVNTQKM